MSVKRPCAHAPVVSPVRKACCGGHADQSRPVQSRPVQSSPVRSGPVCKAGEARNRLARRSGPRGGSAPLSPVRRQPIRASQPVSQSAARQQPVGGPARPDDAARTSRRAVHWLAAACRCRTLGTSSTDVPDGWVPVARGCATRRPYTHTHTHTPSICAKPRPNHLLLVWRPRPTSHYLAAASSIRTGTAGSTTHAVRHTR